jgi:hypothetical protein
LALVGLGQPLALQLEPMEVIPYLVQLPQLVAVEVVLEHPQIVGHLVALGVDALGHQVLVAQGLLGKVTPEVGEEMLLLPVLVVVVLALLAQMQVD